LYQMSGKKLRGRRLGRHKLLIYKQRVVYFSCTYSEPISSTIKPSFRVRQQYPPDCCTAADLSKNLRPRCRTGRCKNLSRYAPAKRCFCTGLSDSSRTILAAKELRHIAQTLVRHLINHRFDVTLY